MAVAFMAILANVVEQRIDATVGKLLLWPRVLLGIASLLWWLRTGDLRRPSAPLTPSLSCTVSYVDSQIFAGPRLTGLAPWSILFVVRSREGAI
jgi:hypothetical protein